MNPLLCGEDLPRYDEIRPEHVAEAVDKLVEMGTKALAAVEADNRPPTWATVIEELNNFEDWSVRIWMPVGHLNLVRNEPALREAYQAAQPKMVALDLKIGQSAGLYAKLLAIKNGPEWQKLDGGQRRTIDNRLLGAKLSGIDLKGEQKERFNKVEEELSQLATKFTNNVIDATKAFKLVLKDKAEVDGLSDSAKEMLAHSYAKQNPPAKPDPANGPWLLTLDMPVYLAFRDFGRNRPLREKLYRAFITRASSGASDNTPLMASILAMRREEALLLGYKTYAELSLTRKMAGSVTEVTALLEELLAASAGPAKEELKEITALANASGHAGALEQWDLYFWAKRLEEQRFGFTEEELKPYFSLPRVLDGMFALVHRLFGIAVKAADGEAPVWNPDTRFFKIFDKAGKHIASFYLDAYSRPENKRGGAWMNVAVMKRVAPGIDRLPVATLTCNFNPPGGDPRHLSRRGRHRRRGMGRCGAAQPVHGELVLPQGHAARHGQALPHRRDPAGGHLREDKSLALFHGRHNDAAADQLRYDRHGYAHGRPAGHQGHREGRGRAHHRYPAAGGGPLSLLVHPPVLGRLRGRLLQLQVGRGA